MEVLSFTSNQPIFLSNFNCLKTKTNFKGILRVEVVIAQVQFQSFEISKTLYTSEYNTVCSDGVTNINLRKKILIKPNTMYEIRMTSSPNLDGFLFCDRLWSPRVDADDGLKIVFHRNPYVNYDNSIYGWISGLQFLRA